MMRVCWFSSTRYTQPLDATQRAKWATLARLDAEMTVIAFATDARFRSFREAARFILLPNLPSALLRYPVALLLMPSIALWQVLRGRVNVIITQSPYEGAAAALVKIMARLLGHKVVLIVEAHGDFEESFFLYRRVPFASLLRGLMRRVSDFALRHADALRAVSSTTCAQLARRAPGKPIEQFMTWTNIDVFVATPRALPLSSTQAIVFAGMLTPLKGVHVLLDAFARLATDVPGAHLYIAGQAQNADYSAQLRQQVAALGLEARVTFAGSLAQADLARQLAGARVLVLPSYSEGLPRVLVEAMAVGTPVIATTVGGIPDIVQEGDNGYLVAPGDVEALATALRRVLTDPQIVTMGERARQQAKTLFSSQAYLEGHQRLLRWASEALG